MRESRDDLEPDILAIVDALIPRLTRATAFDDIMLFAHEALASDAPARPPAMVNTSILLGQAGYISPSDLGSAYRDLQREDQSLVVLPQSARNNPEFTAQMLEGLSPQALRALRRRLAAAHHPDVVSAPANEAAESRMSEINDMIDNALLTATARQDS